MALLVFSLVHFVLLREHCTVYRFQPIRILEATTIAQRL